MLPLRQGHAETESNQEGMTDAKDSNLVLGSVRPIRDQNTGLVHQKDLYAAPDG